MRIASLVSGGGSTMQAVFEAIKSGELPGVEVGLVIASKPTAGAIQKALASGLLESKVVVLRPKSFATEQIFGEEIIRHCMEAGIDVVCQHGWLPHTPKVVIARYAGRITNQHPGALDPGRPDFGGKYMHGLAVHYAQRKFAELTDGNWFTEATAQFVHPVYDRGEVIARQRMEFDADDTTETIAARLLPIEHRLQIEMLRNLRDDAVQILEREVPLVNPKFIPQLEEAKRLAHEKYPNG